MLSREQFHPYQAKAVEHMTRHDESMAWLFLGAGKTISALTALMERRDRLQVFGTLVVAPLRVVQTVWEQEARKWEHTQHLTFSRITGLVKNRVRALNVKADVYLINYENLHWLMEHINSDFFKNNHRNRWPFDMIILDEISKMKNSNTVRHKAFMQFAARSKYKIGLTATPASNGYKDLFGQYLTLDGGVRLGKSNYKFKDKFFDKTGYMGYGIKLKEHAKEAIQAAISDITLQMDAQDYLNLPDVTYNNIMVTLPSSLYDKYEAMERELFLSMDTGEYLEITNRAALTNKCLQFANGAAYKEAGSKEWVRVHDEKLNALDDIIEETGHNPVLVLNNFQHDRERILKKYPHARFMKGGMSTRQIGEMVTAWNNGDIEILVGHPASMGHGLNLQGAEGSSIAWFGLPWSLELYLQANARIHRQGVKHHVVVNQLLTANTMDEAVLLALQSKAITEQELRAAIAAYRTKKLGLLI